MQQPAPNLNALPLELLGLIGTCCDANPGPTVVRFASTTKRLRLALFEIVHNKRQQYYEMVLRELHYEQCHIYITDTVGRLCAEFVAVAHVRRSFVAHLRRRGLRGTRVVGVPRNFLQWAQEVYFPAPEHGSPRGSEHSDQDSYDGMSQ